MRGSFGLSQEYKASIHRAIFNLVTFGKGGWTWDDIYHMPIGLRNIYMRNMSEVIEKENEAYQEASMKSKSKKQRNGPPSKRGK